VSILTATRVIAGVEEGDREGAAAQLLEFVKASARKLRPAASDDARDEAVAETLWKVLAKLEEGPLRTDHEGGAKRYVQVALEHTLHSKHRQSRREAPLTHEVAAEPPEDDFSQVLHDAEAAAERVLEASVVRWPRSESVLRESFAEMVELAGSDRTAADLLGVAEMDADAVRARDALFKRHERSRRKLLGTLADLRSMGELEPLTADLARAYLGWLKRRKG
tara:strand:- start:690 stop:1355 length:666 start_codon:yes stop_codon:yes gene_type:complete